jgi:hypothetical protein
MNCQACGYPIEFDDARFCPNCAAPLEREPEVVEAVPVEAEQDTEPNSVPFEDRSIPFLERYWRTLSLSVSDPQRLLSGLKDEDLTGPVIYAMITGSIVGLIGLVWQTLFGSMFSMFNDYGMEEFAMSGLVNVTMILFMPFFVVAGLFIWSGIYHLCLLLLGTRTRGFGITLRAVAYSYGPQLLGIIPLCGGLVGGVWAMVLTILGGFYGHRTDAWRAVAAYFIPLVLCCGIAMFVWFTIAGAVIASQGL